MTLDEFEEQFDEAINLLLEAGLIESHVDDDGAERIVLTEAGQQVANEMDSEPSDSCFRMFCFWID